MEEGQTTHNPTLELDSMCLEEFAEVISKGILTLLDSACVHLAFFSEDARISNMLVDHSNYLIRFKEEFGVARPLKLYNAGIGEQSDAKFP